MLNARRLLFAALLTAVFTLAARPAAALPKGDLFAGFSRAGSNIFYPNVPALNGWEATGTLRLHKPLLAAELDVAHYGIGAGSQNPHSTTVLFGPQLAVRGLGAKFFVHALVGGEHSKNSATNTPIDGGAFAYALGGGVDIPIAPFFAWRLQADRLDAPSQDTANPTKARFTTGIVFRF